MIKLKNLFLFLSVLLSISCAVKVKTITDSFYGNQYYQTDYMTITGWDTDISLRFIATKNPNIILVSASYSTYNAFTISKNDNMVLKFGDNIFVNLKYTSDNPTVEAGGTYYSGNAYSYGNYTSLYGSSLGFNIYTINASAIVDNIEILTAIRIENSRGYKNLDVQPSFAKKFKKAYEDIKNKINE